MRPVPIPTLALTLALAAAPAAAADLEVAVTGVKDAAGRVRLALYDDPKTFRKEELSLRRADLPAQAGTVSFRLEGLAPGRYAVIAYHDADGNGEMNRLMGMIPTEGYGLSTNPKVLGKPEFADAAFELPAQGLRLEVGLKY